MGSPLLDPLASQATGFLVVLVLKATLVLGGGAIVTRLLARRSAALRHGVWTLAVAALLVLPGVQALAPPLATPLSLAIPRSSLASGPATSPSAIASRSPEVPHQSAPRETQRSAPSSSSSSIGVAPQAPPNVRPADTGFAFSWPVAALLGWLLGAVVVLAYFAAGRITLARISAGAHRIDNSTWLSVATEVAERLGVRQPLRFLTSDSAVGPMTWGIRNPTVLLPAKAAAWPAEQQRSFLLHELAHVARRDCAIQDLAHLVCAFYWFHPGVWYAAHRLRVERERACDDIVLADGASAESYAEHLLEVVRSARTPRGALSVSGAAMAAPSQLETRVRALLDGSLDRRGIGRRRAVTGALFALALTMPLAALAPATRTASAREAAAAQPAQPAPPAGAQQAEDTNGTLAERWQLAIEDGRRQFNGEDFWIVYAIEFRGREGRKGRKEPETLFSDSEGWDLDDLERHGPSFAERFGYSPEDVVFLFRVRAKSSGTNPAFERISIRSARLSPPLGGLSVVSMGRRGIEESFDWLSTRLDRAPQDLRAAVLVTALSLHASPRTQPLLEKILDSSRNSDLRLEAAEGLGRHPGARTLERLVELARNDRSLDVRREAAETVGDLEYAPATNALIALCRELDDESVRAEAVESLGKREPEKVLPVLLEITDRDPSETVRREAVETIGDLEYAPATNVLTDLCRKHKDESVRAEAVETLGKREPEKVIPVLLEITDRDPSETVRREAVETIGDLDYAPATNVLIDLCRKHKDEAVRAEAVESLGDREPERVVPVLVEITDRDPSETVRREAVETLGELPGIAGLEPLRRMAMHSKDPAVRDEAIETLSDLGQRAEMAKHRKD